MGTHFVPDVASLPGEIHQFGHREISTTRPAQCFLPQLAFKDDRIAIKQMLLGPLHRFSHPNVLFILHRFLRDPLKLSQRFKFIFCQLRMPQRLQFVPG